MRTERDKYGRWKNDCWVVTLEQDSTWHCSVGYSIESAQNTCQVMMMKYQVCMDISQAGLVSDPRIGFGIPRLEAPECVDYSRPRQVPKGCWAIQAPTRHQALKIARKDWESRLIEGGVHTIVVKG